MLQYDAVNYSLEVKIKWKPKQKLPHSCHLK